jgi:hypothetical protein
MSQSKQHSGLTPQQALQLIRSLNKMSPDQRKSLLENEKEHREAKAKSK